MKTPCLLSLSCLWILCGLLFATHTSLCQSAASNIFALDTRVHPSGPGEFHLENIRVSYSPTDDQMDLHIAWASAVGVLYDVEWSVDLLKWSTLVSGMSATPPLNVFTNRTAEFGPALFYRVKAVGGSGVFPIEGFAFIPEESFEMGDNFNEGGSRDGPVHTVFVSAFYIGRREVTKAEWDEVLAWAVDNGYSDLPSGGGKGANHPVHSVSWYDVAKWCNAASEREGLMAVYALNGAIYRTGSWNWNQDPGIEIHYAANGYRLPSEAEWEKAARGGLDGQRFPWGNTISHGQANYRSSVNYGYDVSPTREYHPEFVTGEVPYTSPVGSFSPNGYGLYDMAGNVWEWCSDWYDENYYANSPSSDPRGPMTGINRVIRGGGWFRDTFRCRSAARDFVSSGVRGNDKGFRLARSIVP